jgi:isopropylmalate/homocitrate/citramalate synthase
VPAQVRDLAARIAPDLRGRPLGLHLHNTRATGYANAFAGLEHGVIVLDAATGGIGGCPFAPGATGNIATEDLVWMLERSGIATGVDLDALMRLSESLKSRAGAAHSGALLKSGRFPQIARRTAA